MSDIWSYQDTSWSEDVTGYDVEAADGSIGKIDEASNEAGEAYVVVDTGFWIFGKKRLIPAGAIQSIDPSARKVYVSMTKDQIKDAPDYDRSSWNDDTRTQTGDYYGQYRS
jgi:hypothetical protein